MPTITAVTFRPFDVPLDEPFGIAGGTQHVAKNVLVEVRLDDGTLGLGEAAPFPAVNGETQDGALAALSSAVELFAGRDLRRLRPLAELAREVLPAAPSALCAIETALLDAFARHHRVSLWCYFGGSETELVTDITIPTGSSEHATRLAARAAAQGFETLKIKVGGAELSLDVERVIAVHAAAPRAKLVLDANESLSVEQTLELLDALGPARTSVALLEQPTPAADLDSLRQVREQSGIPVAADESARSTKDVVALAAARAASVVNVKIMKTGVFEAWDMIRAARAHGLGLMVGGMVETELAMSTSACLAAGVGGFRFVDLDTPMFLAKRPLSGGFEQSGPRLRLDRIEAGHGVRVSERA